MTMTKMILMRIAWRSWWGFCHWSWRCVGCCRSLFRWRRSLPGGEGGGGCGGDGDDAAIVNTFPVPGPMIVERSEEPRRVFSEAPTLDLSSPPFSLRIGGSGGMDIWALILDRYESDFEEGVLRGNNSHNDHVSLDSWDGYENDEESFREVLSDDLDGGDDDKAHLPKKIFTRVSKMISTLRKFSTQSQRQPPGHRPPSHILSRSEKGLK